MIFKSQVVVLAAAASAVIAAPARSQTVLYANPSIVTDTGIGFGGADLSRADATGSDGWNWKQGIVCADDFVLSSTSVVGSIVFQAYQTFYSGTTGPFNNVTANIWSGVPGDAGSSILFSSNNLGVQSFTNIYRVTSFTNQFNTDRKVWDVEVLFPNIVLNAGTYWWDVTGSGTSPSANIWMPSNGQASGNARQLFQGSWYPMVKSSLPQELGFKVTGSVVPEPGEWAAMGILGAGLAGLVLRRRRR